MTLLDEATDAPAVGARLDGRVMRPTTGRELEKRVEAALVRLSRDRYMTCIECIVACRKLADCALKQAAKRHGAYWCSVTWRRCMPPGVEHFGMLRGKPPCTILDDGRGRLLERLRTICQKEKRGAAAEFEILRYQLKLGAYKWTRTN
jgi:hypothetical protein